MRKEEINQIVKKRLKTKKVDNETTISDPFDLAAIGIDIEDTLGVKLLEEEFMKSKTISDIQKAVDHGSRPSKS